MKIILIIFVFLSAFDSSSDQISLIHSTDNIYLDTTFILKINPTIDDNKFQFIISIFEDSEVFYTKIYIYNVYVFSANDSLIQVLSDTTNGYTYDSTEYGVEGGSLFKDINFDSYLDITFYAGSDYNGQWLLLLLDLCNASREKILFIKK